MPVPLEGCGWQRRDADVVAPMRDYRKAILDASAFEFYGCVESRFSANPTMAEIKQPRRQDRQASWRPCPRPPNSLRRKHQRPSRFLRAVLCAKVDAMLEPPLVRSETSPCAEENAACSGQRLAHQGLATPPRRSTRAACAIARSSAFRRASRQGLEWAGDGTRWLAERNGPGIEDSRWDCL